MANIKKILPSLIDSGNFTIIGDLQVSGTILQSGSVFSASDTGLAANLATTGQTLQTQITSNDGDISTNAGNISTNTSSISTNASNLVTTGQTLQTQITSNDSDISTLTTNLASTGSTLDAKIDTLSGVVALDSETGNHVTTSMTGNFATRTIQESFSQGLNVGTSNDLANRKLHVVGDVEISGTIFQSGSVFEGGGGGGSSTFTGLADTPSSFTAGKYLTVNSAGTAIEMTNSIQSGFATSDQELFTELTLAGATTGIVQYASGSVAGLDLADNKWDVSIVEETDVDFISGDSSWTDVSLLLPFDGTSGAASTSDSSNANRTVTFYGTAQLSTAQSKFGGSSLLLDGNSDYLTVPHVSSDIATELTLETWFKTSSSAYQTMIGSYQEAQPGNGAGCFIQINGGTPDGGVHSSTFGTSSSGGYADGNWHHIALTRNASNLVTLWVDGVSKATITDSSALPASPFHIGRLSHSTLPRYFDGYLDDVRWTPSVCRYTSAFTPPSTAHLTSAGDVNKQIIVNSAADGVAVGTGGINQARIAKAWVNFNGTGTVAIRGSYNVSSITDNGTGAYTVNFSAAMTDANYCCNMNSGDKAAVWGIPLFDGVSTFLAGSCKFYTQHPNDVPFDNPIVCASFFGN